ncbi:MAG: hypothetical protein IJ211_05190 [Campylobacter sp.]|nr:hypothetical protein [Campylobacter sp.]
MSVSKWDALVRASQCSEHEQVAKALKRRNAKSLILSYFSCCEANFK